MERLTSCNKELEREMICRHEDCDTSETYCPHLNEANCPCLREVLNKLAHYEDLEEQGLLLKLPCKEGDTVYTVSSYMECCREECKWLEEECEECWDYQRVYFVKETNFQIQMIALFGKTVFLTKEEAEAKLKELEDE